MTDHDDELTFFHCPRSRSAGVYTLLEELGAPYKLHLIDLKNGDTRKPEYLAINPMGKVPALRHRGQLVTEQVAVYLYLADLFPQAGLAPALDDPLRGPYLRWMAFYGSSFEPGLIDRTQKRTPAPLALSPYGDYETMMKTVLDQLAAGPWMLGERYSAVDVLWGSALAWTTGFGIVEKSQPVAAYLERFHARPAVQRATAKNTELAESLG